ncbi:MAG TPA: ABC transporter ATP-binding protein [Candidatus Hydrogenedentes bacterium]|nr:ABC transporter ATP-binding protein [Candidatus Hydrogenedentota bacterium]
MNEPAVETRNLSKTYKSLGKRPVHSLRGLNLSIAPNQVFGFLGRNGAGKTTTIKLLCGLIRPTAGEAWLFGRNCAVPESRQVLGYLSEQPYFYEYLTPRETVEFYARLRGVPPERRGEQWERLRDLLELEEFADRRIREFSKGMRQRVGFAIALVGDPPLLILDEPMSGLDPVGRHLIRNVILKLKAEGKTIFFSSHVLSDVEELCDRIAILVSGSLELEGAMDNLPGRRVLQVEVIASGLDAATVEAIASRASHRRVESGEAFRVNTLEEANAIAAQVIQRGGTLVALRPVRETLEEYFARVQQHAADRERESGT